MSTIDSRPIVPVIKKLLSLRRSGRKTEERFNFSASCIVADMRFLKSQDTLFNPPI